MGFLFGRKKKPAQRQGAQEAFYHGDLYSGMYDTSMSGFCFRIEDVFSITGRGTVATGTVESGMVRVGDRVSCNGRVFMVDGIEAFRKVMDHAKAGDRAGLLLRGASRSDFQIGGVLTGGC